ncbi:hypothetical protein [Streptococcus zalophi]
MDNKFKIILMAVSGLILLGLVIWFFGKNQMTSNPQLRTLKRLL